MMSDMLMTIGLSTESPNTSGLNRLKLVFSEVTMFSISPKISTPFMMAKTAPSIRLTHPSMTSLRMPSIIRASSPRMMNVTARMMANAVTLRTASDAVMYSASWVPKGAENLAAAHTPAMMDIMEFAWDMNPFLMPCTRAGTRQIKIMISNIFINTPKCVYLQFEISGNVSRLQK